MQDLAAAMEALATAEKAAEKAERMAAERLAAQQRADMERRRERESKEEESKTSFGEGEQKMEFQPAVVERPKTKRLQRPTTARKRPPTIRQKVKVVEQKKEELQEDMRAQGVMLEGEDSEEEDEDIGREESKLGDSSKVSTDDKDDAEHGRLVRDILESEKNKKSGESKSNDESKNEDGGIRMSRIGSQGESNRTKVDIKVLRKQVQILCRGANPLGGSIDFVHDDMELMKKEYVVFQSVTHFKGLALL